MSSEGTEGQRLTKSQEHCAAIVSHRKSSVSAEH